MDNVTALIVNYRTLDLTRQCVESFRRFYPGVRMLLIDNGSGDESSDYIRSLAARHAQIASIHNPKNRFHGPALDQGIRACQTRLALTLDSDVEIQQGGFLEQMAALFNDPNLYALGCVVHMDWFGYEVARPGRLRFYYVRPCCMLLEQSKYLRLKPFIHHGSPGIKNMKDAQRRGYRLQDFPIYEYIHHHGQGTCGHYGYGLGVKHSAEYLLRRLLLRLSTKAR